MAAKDVSVDPRLHGLAWLLTDCAPNRSEMVVYDASDFGDAGGSESSHEILDAVGRDRLLEIIGGVVESAGTSCAVYEQDGRYAAGILLSPWCRMLDEAGRRRGCGTADRRVEANDAVTQRVGFPCHGFRLHETSRAALETTKPHEVDISGGLRLFTVPILAEGGAVGAIGICLGNPPEDAGALKRIAQDCDVPVSTLRDAAASTRFQPPHLVELAKSHAATAAGLIGEIFQCRRTEELLLASEEKYQRLIDEAPDMIHVVDREGRILEANPIERKTLGYTREEFLGKHLLDVVHPAYHELATRHLATILDGQSVSPFETAFVAKDGRTIPLEANIKPILEHGAVVAVRAVLHNITDRKRAEQQIENMARFPSENPHPVLRIAAEGSILYANTAAWQHLSHLGAGTQDPAPAEWQRLTVEVLQSGTITQIDVEDGDRILSFYLVPICQGPYVNWYGHDVTARRHAERTAILAQKELLDQQRQATARVEAELEKVREELVRQTRLATVGHVSASIAHEVRNPLGSVRNAACYLKRHVPKDDPTLIEFLNVIEEEVGRADRVIRNLLDMSRAKTPQRRACNLGEVVREVLSQTEDMEQVECLVVTTPQPFEVHADPDQLRQLLANLVSNAVQAMEGHGKLTIEAVRHEKWETITVRDTGPGIAPDVRNTLFEPLVTNKTKGVGLGLTICRQIVEHHGGTIEATCGETNRPRNADTGATFTIRLPRS